MVGKAGGRRWNTYRRRWGSGLKLQVLDQPRDHLLLLLGR